VRKMDIRIKVAWLLNGTTYIATVCMILFKCWPLNRQWQIYPDPGSESLAHKHARAEVDLISRQLLPWCFDVECVVHHCNQHSHGHVPHGHSSSCMYSEP